MSRTVVASVILILCFTLGISALLYVETACKEMIDIIDETIISVSLENDEEISENLIRAIDEWEKSRPWLNLIVGQDDTTEIRGNLNKSIFFCNYKDYNSAILHLQECKTGLNRIITTTEPTISTIL